MKNKPHIERFENPQDPGNSDAYHTGKICIEPECDLPAGTWWSKLWCFKHNAARMKRIDEEFSEVAKGMWP